MSEFANDRWPAWDEPREVEMLALGREAGEPLPSRRWLWVLAAVGAASWTYMLFTGSGM